MKRLILIVCFLLLATRSYAAGSYHGWCEQGNATPLPSPPNTIKVQQSFPVCTITVFNTGTITPATLYSDNMGTPLSNPFTNQSSLTGQFFFFATDGAYDIRIAATGLTTYTLANVNIWDSSGQIIVGVNGTPSAPAIVGANFLNTGIYWATGNSSNLCINIDGSDPLDDLAEPGICVNSYGLGVGASPAAQLHLSNNVTTPFAWTASGIALRIDPATYTDEASSGTVATVNMSRINRPTIATTHVTTYTTATTLDIAGCPIAGTDVTITNCNTMVIEAGNVILPSFTFNTSSQILGNTGSASLPVYSFGADPATGAYFPTTHTYGISTNGTLAVKWDGSQNQTNTGEVIAARYVAPSTTTSNNQVMQATATTGALYENLSNTSGQSRWGVESSAGGALFTGSNGYASVFGSVNNEPVQIFTNNTLAITLDTSQNLTLTGTASINNGGHAVYRCVTAGAARAGTLTIVAADCGSTQDTGLRVP